MMIAASLNILGSDLNTEMRWRALQAGQIYVRQHPGDAQLSVDEL